MPNPQNPNPAGDGTTGLSLPGGQPQTFTLNGGYVVLSLGGPVQPGKTTITVVVEPSASSNGTSSGTGGKGR